MAARVSQLAVEAFVQPTTQNARVSQLTVEAFVLEQAVVTTTKITANEASIYITDSSGTCRALSAFLSHAMLSTTAIVPDVTGFGGDTIERLSGGIKDWALSLNGFWLRAVNETDAILHDIGPGGTTYMRLGPGGSTTGCVMYAASAVLQDYNIILGIKESANISMNLIARSGSLTRTTW